MKSFWPMKMVPAIALALGGAFALSGCTDTEVAAGAAAAGAAVIVANSHHHHYHGGYYHGHYYRPYSVISLDDTTPGAFQSTDPRVEGVADAYGITDYAATYVVRAILLAQNNDLSGLNQIGLQASDLQALVSGHDLEAAKVSAVSQKLQMTPQATTALIDHLRSDIQAQMNQ